MGEDKTENVKEHTLSVEQRCIPRLFAAVNMYPTLAVNTVDLCPDVVLGVPDPSHSAANRAAKHGEAVGPLSDAAASGLKQNEGVVVSGEALI